MLLCSVAAVVLKVTVAVPVVGLAAGLVYVKAKVLPLASPVPLGSGRKKIASVFDGHGQSRECRPPPVR